MSTTLLNSSEKNYVYMYSCMYIHIYTHTYIHIHREKEKDTDETKHCGKMITLGEFR